jgi:hypothetical protein
MPDGKRQMKAVLSIILIQCFGQAVWSQPTDPRIYPIRKASGAIRLDGQLNEQAWISAQLTDTFFCTFPFDTGMARTRTDVMLTYDDRAIYLAARCYDPVPGPYIIQSLKRDFSYPVSDAFGVNIDPFNDGQNGFNFSINPLGVQREGLIQVGGEQGVTTAWDNKWMSEVVRDSGHWTVEMAIPFKSIRYDHRRKEWGINFTRNDLKQNEGSTWAWVPRNQNIANLAFRGLLVWDVPPKKAGANISIIPYATGGLYHDYRGENRPVPNWGIGGDVKVALTSSLNLDATIYPDFSQVEVDRQITNLSRFSLFFPEQRQFFIENSDLFASFGFSKIRPFFSRRIGLYNGQRVPLFGGIRVSGKIGQGWRVGLMGLQTEGVAALSLNSQNFLVAAVQRNVFKRSNIAAIFVNREDFKGIDLQKQNYNRLVGLDYNLFSANGRWRGKFFFHHTFSPDQRPNAYAHASWLMYNSQNLTVHWNHEYVGEGYDAQVGFVPRGSVYDPVQNKDVKLRYWRFEPSVEYRFYPKSRVVNYHGPGLYFDTYLDAGFSRTDHVIRPFYVVKFQNTSQLDVNYFETYTRLLYATDVTFSGKAALPVDGYWYREGELRYTTDKRKRLNGVISGRFGSYFNGIRGNFYAELAYRWQPYGIFSVVYDQNEISLATGQRASIIVVGPKLEFSFTRSVFLTTFFQYNTQQDNFNINARVQWRFRPMSDVYLVYTDNYDQHLAVKNRAIVLKLVWWITV